MHVSEGVNKGVQAEAGTEHESMAEVFTESYSLESWRPPPPSQSGVLWIVRPAL